MIWLDILLEKEFPSEQLETVLSRVFSIDGSQIKIIGDILELDETPVVCLTRRLSGGQFKTLLTILLTIYMTFGVSDVSEKLLSLASQFGISILVADDGNSSPYSMVQYMPSGDVRQAEVDPDDLDSNGEYFIKKTGLELAK